ncbi:HPr(Ser) kinase/phosphatase [Anaerolentibacter hominis]|uniref:HPr(Ser) kinase/phosphatase n=1 Tax=Anaerolentibacter hominis TaxID=3079009 RepID=UPI0031B85B44
MYSVSLTKVIEHMKLENCTPDLDISEAKVTHTDVNRPALQLTGFFDFFDSNRIQVIGHVENLYMHQKSEDEGAEMMRKMFEYNVPCVVFCRNIEFSDKVLEYAMQYKIPLLRTKKSTSAFMAEVIRWLHVELAPRISIHGVLVDVYGEGVLITGESGIGKSEAALELIKRGHRLVSDDVVELRKVSEQTLIGTAPDITRHFIELRGIGIVDVKSLFGVGSVRETKSIDLVIHLSDFDKDMEYDRLGIEEKFIEYLGNKVVCHNIPIRPGRNLAIICESAAVNHRQKKMGYNAAEELYKRVTNNLNLKRE